MRPFSVIAFGATLLLLRPAPRVGFPNVVVQVSKRTLKAGRIRNDLLSVEDANCSFRQGCHSRVKMMAKRPRKGTSNQQNLLESAVENQDSPEPNADDAALTATFSIDKLKAETIAPFRTARIFLYGAFGFSALIGGATACTQLAATLSNQPGALELKDVLINLLVDFGVMAAAAFCYNFEMSQQEGLQEAQATLREKRKRLEQTQITDDVNAARVEAMRRLAVKVPTDPSEENLSPREATVDVLMDQAKQAFCVLAGGRDFLMDSMLSAMIAKTQIFRSLNLLVVPVNMDSKSDSGEDGRGKGFAATQPSYEQGYVAEPVNEAQWRKLMRQELDAAERQGAVTDNGGIVLLVSKDGEVLRRGVGVPVWKTLRDDIDPPKNKKAK